MPGGLSTGQGLTPLDRFPIEDVRLRRALGRLGIQLESPSGLTLTFLGLSIDPKANGGIGVDTAGVFVLVQAPIFTDVNGVGLHYGNGLTVTSSNLVVSLATTPGLQFVTGNLSVLLKPGGGLAVDAAGIYSTVAGGGVTSVSGTVPIVSSGGTTPAISLTYGSGLALSGGTTLIVDNTVYVPYTGATTNVNLGTRNLSTNQLTSTVAVGTAPLVVTSTTAVTNLNADMVDGVHAASFALAANYVPYTGATTDVDLGTHALDAKKLTVTGVTGTGVGVELFADVSGTDTPAFKMWTTGVYVGTRYLIIQGDVFSRFNFISDYFIQFAAPNVACITSATYSGFQFGDADPGCVFQTYYGYVKWQMQNTGPGGIGFDFNVGTLGGTYHDYDCRFQGKSDANLLYTDAGNDRVGVGTATPGTKLEVAGVATATFHQTSTAPTANSTGTVVIVAKDAAALTANAGWLPFKKSDGTTVYVPYWT